MHISTTKKTRIMKTVTTKKEVCQILGIPTVLVLVNEVVVCKLYSVSNPVKEGYDSRVRFEVSNYKNDLGLTYWSNVTRSIKDVVKYFYK